MYSGVFLPLAAGVFDKLLETNLKILRAHQAKTGFETIAGLFLDAPTYVFCGKQSIRNRHIGNRLSNEFMKPICIRGSTGSIGTPSLDVIFHFPDGFTVTGRNARGNT